MILGVRAQACGEIEEIPTLKPAGARGPFATADFPKQALRTRFVAADPEEKPHFNGWRTIDRIHVPRDGRSPTSA
jgi:hypothetical protein